MISVMCGRMTLTEKDPAALATALGADLALNHAALYRPRWNVAPTDQHWMVVLDDKGRLRLGPAVWGLRSQHTRPLINLRSETAASRRDFQQRRCVAISDGFYEWRAAALPNPEPGTSKPARKWPRQPFWFARPGGGLLLHAGVWEVASPGDDARWPRFAIFTTTPNHTVGAVHDRMPALLPPQAVQAWLSTPAADLLAPAPDDYLVARAVGPAVGNVRNDGPDLLTAS